MASTSKMTTTTTTMDRMYEDSYVAPSVDNDDMVFLTTAVDVCVIGFVACGVDVVIVDCSFTSVIVDCGCTVMCAVSVIVVACCSVVVRVVVGSVVINTGQTGVFTLTIDSSP